MNSCALQRGTVAVAGLWLMAALLGVALLLTPVGDQLRDNVVGRSAVAKAGSRERARPPEGMATSGPAGVFVFASGKKE